MSDNVVWRVLPWQTNDAYTNMAIDKTIAESVAAGGLPTIRFYKWAGNGAVSLGKNETITDIDITFCEQQKIPYVRRFTGGRAMYHSPQDLTYAIAAPLSVFPTRLLITSDISRWIMQFLDELKVPSVQYAGIASVTSHGRKLSGGVPHYEKKTTVLQHGSVFYSPIDYSFQARLFKQPEELVKERTTSIVTELGYDVEDILLLFQRAFLENLRKKHEEKHQEAHFEIEELTEAEWRRVAVLQQEYASEEWIEKGKLALGICNITWGRYPGFWKDVKEELRSRLLDKEAK